MSTMAAKIIQMPPSELTEERARREWTALLGMIFFLAAWAMMFSALFFSYAMVRVGTNVWPPVNAPEFSLLLPAINSVLIALSSFVLHRGVVCLRTLRLTPFRNYFFVGSLLAGLFLVLQWHFWSNLTAAGLTPDSGLYGSVIFGLTWVHAAHVLVGFFALIFLSFQAWRQVYRLENSITVRLWTMYWHFVGVVWLLMFVTIFIM
jgi:cytochrome c oxidase subunit 3